MSDKVSLSPFSLYLKIQQSQDNFEPNIDNGAIGNNLAE